MSTRLLFVMRRFLPALLAAALAGACAGPAAAPASPVALQSPTPAQSSPTPEPAASSPPASDTPAPSESPLASATESPSDTPVPSATPVPDPVLIAAGDIASCVSEGDEATALLVEAISGTVITMGDNVYERGTAEQFAGCYDPTWGRFKNRTRPSPGNHDYLTPGAAAYFEYFGAAAGELGKGYYSYDLGAWHIIALNSVCWEVGGCGDSSPQAEWLTADLQASASAMCTLAYWHHPRFSSGLHGDFDLMQTLWDVLYAGGADVVLNGHDHHYERFAPQDPQGAADTARGIRQFIAGTGGRILYPLLGPPHSNTEVRSDEAFGVLTLTLHAASYDWDFVPVAGETFTDAGSGECHD